MLVLGLHLLNGLEKGTGKGWCVTVQPRRGPTQDLTTGPPSQASAPWVTELLSSSAGFFSFLARFSQVTSLGSNWTICFKRKSSSFGFWGGGFDEDVYTWGVLYQVFHHVAILSALGCVWLSFLTLIPFAPKAPHLLSVASGPIEWIFLPIATQLCQKLLGEVPGHCPPLPRHYR